MSWAYRTFLRPLLFALDSEAIHHRTLQMLGCVSRQPVICEVAEEFFGAPNLPVDLFGLHFPSPIGLAAGMDKYAEAVPVWQSLGFGFTELGGVTWHPQAGNPQPRLFRAVSEQALINRMGFNNLGAEAMAEKLAAWRAVGRWPKHPVGINLGKSKITPIEHAAEDYANSFRALWPHADFFVVNVSSPNTPNLRQLQDKAALDEILAAMQAVNLDRLTAAYLEQQLERGDRPSLPSAAAHHVSRTSYHEKPILIKVAPDLSLEALDEILDLVDPRQVAGIIATNTTITRPDTSDEVARRAFAEPGGLSGHPLRARSTEVIRHLYRQTKGVLPIIGVGGIFGAEDAWEKIAAGASLVQLYTGLVYEGPGVAKQMVAGLRERLIGRGIRQLSDAVGLEA